MSAPPIGQVKQSLDGVFMLRSAISTCDRLLAGCAEGQLFRVEAKVQGHFGTVCYNQTHHDIVDATLSDVVKADLVSHLEVTRAMLVKREALARRILALDMLGYLTAKAGES
jgi:hypothetical protein